MPEDAVGSTQGGFVAIAVGAPTVLIGLLLIWRRLRAKSRPSQIEKQKHSVWNDDPIRSADRDAYEHLAIAKRIAGHVSHPQGPRAVALIGRFGAGKTSICHLTIEQLEKEAPWVIVVPVSAWPYESSAALVRGILEHVIAKLAERAGWEALRHVPAAYREAVEGSAGSIGKILRILERSRLPEDLLREIDDVALALRIRIVVWAEDLERFAPTPEGEPLESESTREKLEPVRALLHQLQELRNVTIVVATTRLTGFDLEKLARFIESLPPLSQELALPRLQKARFEALKVFESGGLIDLVPSKQRARFSLLSEPAELSRLLLAAARARGTAHVDWAEALCILSPTPRTLKQGIRDFQEIWQLLAGEIDIDHALGASLLRHAEPAVFQMLVSQADFLRPSGNLKPNYQQILEPFGLPEDRREAVTTLLRHLFGHDSVHHPQGFGRTHPVDYWARFLARSPIAENDRDQVVLKALQAFVTDGSEDLVKLSMQSEVGKKIRAFRVLLPTRKVLDLLDGQLHWIHENRGKCPTWSNEGDPLGLSDTWGICIEQAEGGDWSISKAFDIVDKHVQASVRGYDLKLANWLLYWFGTHSESLADRLSEPDRKTLRANFVDAMLHVFHDNPDGLALALEDVEPVLLYRLCYGVHRERAGAKDKPFPKWAQFAKTVEIAAHSHPEVMLPQLSYFLTRSSQDVHTRAFKATVDREAAARLFPKADLISLYAAHPQVKDSDPETRARLAALQEAAAGQAEAALATP